MRVITTITCIGPHKWGPWRKLHGVPGSEERRECTVCDATEDR